MKRTFIILVMFILSTAWYGCGVTKKSTMDRLKNKTDVIGSMVLVDPPNSNEQAATGELIDSQKIKDIPKSINLKKIRIKSDSTPLLKGPGSKYQKIGTAAKGDLFDLIRIERGYGKGETWYLVEDATGSKFFVPSKQSRIIHEKSVRPVMSAQAQKNVSPKTPEVSQEKPEKIELQKRQKVSLDKIQTVVSVEPELPEELKEAKHITLNFEGTELYDVITTFCELLKIDYVIEGNVDGKVTLQTFNKIPVEDLYSVLEQILALNNVTVVKSGNFYRFLEAPDAAKKPLSIHFADDPSIPNKERMIIQIIPLQHISVESMRKIITPLLTTNASFIEVPETNNLMMIEMAYNVKRIVKVVQALDIDKLASSDIQLYKLRNADSEVMVKELEEIFSSMGYKEALGDSLSFLSLTRLNSILVVNAFDKILPTIEFWVNRLDQPVSEGDVSTFVYYVQNGDSGALAGLLNGIFASSGNEETKTNTSTGKTSTTAATKANVSGASTTVTAKKSPTIEATGAISGDFEGEITILPDPDTNSLIIRTSPRNYPAILALINKLDLSPQQVLIEVLIVDLTIDNSTAAGLELAIKNPGGADANTVAGGISATTDGATSLGGSIGSATASFLRGGSYFIGQPDKIIAQLQLFASDSKTNVLANPILVTSDNKAANISITDEIPIVQEASVPSGGAAVVTSTVEFRSVGIKLDITPKINSKNLINLRISQEISSLGAEASNGQPSFNTRQVNTEVVLKDNQVLVMGGLMRTDTTDTTTGVPFFKDLPYIGKLFGSESTSLKKTELMIFITPHVISNADDSEFVTSEFKKRLTNLKSIQHLGS